MGQHGTNGVVARIVPAVAEPAAVEASDEELVREYFESLAKSTLATYRKNLTYFARYLGVDSPAAAVTALVGGGPANANRIVLKYRSVLRDAGLKSATIANRLAALRSAVAAFQAAGRIIWTLHIKSPHVDKYRDTRGPGDDGWDAMRAVVNADAEGGTPKTIRDRAMVRLDHNLALRVSELVGIDVADLECDGDLPTGVWVLRKGKTDRQLLEIPEITGARLRSWLAVRGKDPGPLFVRLDRAARAPTRITPTGVYQIVGKIGVRAGIKRRMSPHRLRHHAITKVSDRNNGNLVETAAFSGTTTETLKHYIDNKANVQGKGARSIADED